FAGWAMPIQYAGIIAEHHAVRRAWGIFDVSHMGRILLSGPNAVPLIDSLLSVSVAELRQDRARYGLLCVECGGILDDVVVLRQSEDRLMVICNAANRLAVMAWIGAHAAPFPNVHIVDVTSETVMLAVQGPQTAVQSDGLLGQRVSRLKRFGGTEINWREHTCVVTRTGYTGEDGFEIIAPTHAALPLWDAFLAAGATPCGLGARDTLRLEAGLLLHGNDMDSSVNPLEAGLDRFVTLEGREFMGRSAIVQAKSLGLSRRLAGFKTRDRGPVPRKGFTMLASGRRVGVVTSGAFSPTLQTNIGLGFVPSLLTEPGTRVEVDIRGTSVAADVVSLPFYKRA
ncbi:MAG: glycine cleavage system aminomethyltransferase GcvT, partial [Chloroflexi bacterium]|nr:glycine cleavage system aminomethyltransferase GcvT [Chloroflexota bacterium]